MKKPKPVKKLGLAALATSSLRHQFKTKVQNPYEELEAQGNLSAWETFKQAIIVSSGNTIPIKETRKKQKWMTDEILDLMSETKTSKTNKYE